MKKEDKILNSRFDFTGVDQNNIPFVMEVKNVPLADYEDLTAKERKKHCFDGRCVNSKVAYFPDGYRKKATDTISPRALKHLNDLILLKKQHKNKGQYYIWKKVNIYFFAKLANTEQTINSIIKITKLQKNIKI